MKLYEKKEFQENIAKERIDINDIEQVKQVRA